jgi:AraC-like DNA-binding protein
VERFAVQTREPLRHLTAAYLTAGRVVVGGSRAEQRFGPGDVVLYPYGVGFEARWSTIDQGLLRIDFGSVAKLAAATTDSAPATFRFLGTFLRRPLRSTPMGYLRRVRLDRAHCELQAADPTRGDTVGQIARRWGFANRSRFVASYRRAYGVSPSHTLRT